MAPTTSTPARPATAPARRPAPVRGLTATAAPASVEVAWQPYRRRLVDHYEVYASTEPRFEPGPETLLGRSLYPHIRHYVGPREQTWHYAVVTVVDSGARSRPSERVTAASRRMLAAGTPLAQVGEFDHRGLELALSPGSSAEFLPTFPDGVDFTHGTSDPAEDWCYLHPGPKDSWAGRRQHTFTLRFTLDAVPAGDPGFALWLIDAHATLAGTADLAVNGKVVTTVEFPGGATRGSLEGDATVLGTVLKPSFTELRLPAAAFTAGENTLAITKTAGSWIAYDAVGVFAPE